LALLVLAGGSAEAQVQESVDHYRSGDAQITIECFAPAARGKFPAVLLLHASGGLDATADVYREIGRDLAAHGYVVLFPHYFERTGHVPGVNNRGRDIPAFVQSAQDAIEFAAALPDVDADRIGLLGYSMGAYLAFVRAARDPRIKAVVSCAGGLPVESKSTFPPVLILQGANDKSNPLERVKAFEEVLKAKETPYETHIYRGMGHNFDFPRWDDAARRARVFFDKHVKKEEPKTPKAKMKRQKMNRVAPAGETADPVAVSLLAAHNREREKEDRRPLALSAKLCAAAAVHAKDMALHQKQDHTGSDGSKIADRVKRKGYVYRRVGENIAWGQQTVDEVMTTWMNSPPHRENILADFTEMGAARFEDPGGEPYWCVDFGIPMPELKADEAAAAVVKKLNGDRKAAHKPVFKAETKLGRAAMAVSAAMADKDSIDMEKDAFKLIDAQGIRDRELRLQLSGNVPDPEEATKLLLGDAPAELDGFREIGVGYAIAKSGTPYWCAIFARPVGEKPRAVRQRERRVGESKKP